MSLKYEPSSGGGVEGVWLMIYGQVGGRGTARAEDAQGTSTRSHISPRILVYEDKLVELVDGTLLGYTWSEFCKEADASFSGALFSKEVGTGLYLYQVSNNPTLQIH